MNKSIYHCWAATCAGLLLAAACLPQTAPAQDVTPVPQPHYHARPEHVPHSHRQPGTGQPEGPAPTTVTETVAHSLCSLTGCADGEESYSSLMLASDGNYYGTAYNGGTSDEGAIFQFNPTASAFQVIYSFCSQADCADGNEPYGGLVQDAEGNLWGMTYEGGTSDDGVIYKVTTTGAYTVMHNFSGGSSDGEEGYGALTLGDDGNLYGMTYDGGAESSGMLFRITPAGAFTVLHQFCSETNCDDGEEPYGDLVQGADGKLYGMTNYGGTGYYGIIFSIATDGTGFTVVHNFCVVNGCPDGYEPKYGHLTQYSDGSFYGMTAYGGTNDSGEIFKVTPGGTFTPLYGFCPATGCLDGESPTSSTLTLGTDGNFYGVTEQGGDNYGTFFQITPAGVFTKLYDFCSLPGCTDGAEPYAGVTLAPDGSFYGTTYEGGATDDGAVYHIMLSTAPPAAMAVTAPGSTAMGEPTTISFTLANAYSTTMQQCYAFATQQFGAATVYPLGKVPVTLNNGVLSGSITATPGASGTYLVAVTCGGTQTATTTVAVTAPVVTTTTLTPASSSITSGQTDNLSVTVTAADSSIVGKGTVTVRCNGNVVGTEAVSAGAAVISGISSEANAGTYNCVASYLDSTYTYAASTSSASTITDAKQTSSVVLTSASYSVTSGASVTLTATVSGQYATPTLGYVRFRANNHVLGTVPVNNSGVATLTLNATAAAGTYTVYADYLGTGITQPSSGNHSFTVTP